MGVFIYFLFDSNVPQVTIDLAVAVSSLRTQNISAYTRDNRGWRYRAT